MHRRLGNTGLVLAAFVAGIALTFPTDAITRRVLAATPLPDGMRLSFARARLRPNGLLLDDVHVTRRDGAAAFDAEWVRLRPSLWGLWHDGGRPWTVAAATCQGAVEIGVGLDPTATPVTITLANVQVATCVPYLTRPFAAHGRVSGTIHARFAPRDLTSGEAALDLRDASWRLGGALEDLEIRADVATMRGRLAERRFELETFEVSGADLRATGRGSVRLVDPPTESVLDVRLSVTPGRTMPLVLRRWFDAAPGPPPDPTGTRTFRLQGTVANPRLAGVGTLG
ncbi:MAG: type II secretion system protein GspN [Candidatus Binatia bacterium]